MNRVTEIELHIGRRLIEARQLRDVSQETLAQEVGVNREQIEEYEQGRKVLTPARLYDIARVLQVDVSYFYEGLNEATERLSSLPDEQYAFLRDAVRRIAADHEITAGGRRKRLSIRTAIQIARNICDLFGWNYGNKSDAIKTSLLQWEQESRPNSLAIKAKKPAAPSEDRTRQDLGPVNCLTCHGIGWVCERHGDRPRWTNSRRTGACDCNCADKPCPMCNAKAVQRG